MGRMIVVGSVLAFVACDSEPTTNVDPCTVQAKEVAQNEPLWDGQSVDDVLGVLPLDAEVSPTWFDEADRPLQVTFAPNTETAVVVEVQGDDPSCEVPLSVVQDMRLSFASVDDLLDEVFSFEAALEPGAELTGQGVLRPEDLRGTLDLGQVILPKLDPELDYVLSLALGATVDPLGELSGVILATADSGDAAQRVEQTLATW